MSNSKEWHKIEPGRWHKVSNDNSDGDIYINVRFGQPFTESNGNSYTTSILRPLK